jgi:hypothetical protein
VILDLLEVIRFCPSGGWGVTSADLNGKVMGTETKVGRITGPTLEVSSDWSLIPTVSKSDDSSSHTDNTRTALCSDALTSHEAFLLLCSCIANTASRFKKR